MTYPGFNIWYHNYIIWLILFKPGILFNKINGLPWYQQTLQQWFASLQTDAGCAILEVGCGTGQLTSHIGQLGLNVVGIDHSAHMLRLAKQAISSNVRFEKGSALSLPFKENQFDHVIAGSLLNIISQPELALTEMLRVCKPGGKVSVLVPLAGMTTQDVNGLANDLKLAGFSRAALHAWHNRAPKMQCSTLSGYFKNAGIFRLNKQTYLKGLVITITGIK